MNSTVHTFQIFYREHTCLFIFYAVFITGIYFDAHQGHISFSWRRMHGAKQRPPSGAQVALPPKTLPGAPGTPAMHSGICHPLEFHLEKGCGGSSVPETIPPASSDVTGLQAAAGSILYSANCSQNIGCFFFSWNNFCSVLPRSWGLSQWSG